MPEWLAPGVYVEEIATGARTITGVSTAVAGFVGITGRGPDGPQLVSGWDDFLAWFGGPPEGNAGTTAHAVKGFFDNGGQMAYLARVVGGGASTARGSLGNVPVQAVGRGAWGNNLYLRVLPAAGAGVAVRVLFFSRRPEPFVDPFDPTHAQDLARRTPDVVENHAGLSLDPAAANFLVRRINEASRLVRVAAPAGPAAVGPGDWFALAGGNDGAPPTPDDFAGDATRGTGLAGLAGVPDVALVVVPDHVRDPALTAQVVRHCEALGGRLAVLAVDEDFDPGRPGSALPVESSFAAAYHPWLRVADLAGGPPRTVPPVGHVAGVMARTDLEQGVHRPPASAVVLGALDPARAVGRTEADALTAAGVNPIRDFRARGLGLRVWGARTLSPDPQWRNVNVRRLLIYLEASIARGTQWAVFEPNDESTWANVRRAVEDFLVNEWRAGVLAGTTPAQAFFVRCDRTTMTQDDLDRGRLVCLVGVAPVRPAEFVVVRIGQVTASGSS